MALVKQCKCVTHQKVCAKRDPYAAGELHNFTQDSSESSTKFFPHTLRDTH